MSHFPSADCSKRACSASGNFFLSGLIVKSRAHEIENSHRLEIKCWPSLELKGQLKGTGALRCEFKFSMTCKIKYLAWSEQDLNQHEILKARTQRVTCTAISYQLVSITWAHSWHQRAFDRFPGTIIALSLIMSISSAATDRNWMIASRIVSVQV